jgi:hypothetical protein
MKLYDLPARQDPGQRPKILGLNPDGHEDGWVEFDHLDGMYSYCVAYDGAGKELGVCHLAGMTPLLVCDGGYRVQDTDQTPTPSPDPI